MVARHEQVVDDDVVVGGASHSQSCRVSAVDGAEDAADPCGPSRPREGIGRELVEALDLRQATLSRQAVLFGFVALATCHRAMLARGDPNASPIGLGLSCGS